MHLSTCIGEVGVFAFAFALAYHQHLEEYCEIRDISAALGEAKRSQGAGKV